MKVTGESFHIETQIENKMEEEKINKQLSFKKESGERKIKTRVKEKIVETKEKVVRTGSDLKKSEGNKISSFSKESQTKKSQSADSKGLIVVVRITGEVKVKPEIVNTLYRLRLRRKYTCALINSSNKGLMGMLWEVRHSVAYGDIDKELLVKLLNARGQKTDGKKLNAEEAASELMNGKKLEELGFKPFFRLHPPRKGINSKLQYPKGVLGNNKNDINKLIERML